MSEGTPAARSSWRWAVATLVLVLLAHPLGRWMRTRSDAAAARVPARVAQAALQDSFEHYQAGRYREAVAAARSALAADPELAGAYDNLAISYAQIGQFDEALPAVLEAIRLRPDDPLARENLAWIRSEQAKATGSPLPADLAGAAAALLDRSLQQTQAGRFEDCIDLATESAILEPSAAAFNNAGFCAGKLQRWDVALRNAEAAVRLAPEEPLFRNNLSWILRQSLERQGVETQKLERQRTETQRPATEGRTSE